MKRSLSTLLFLASVIFIVKANDNTKKVKTEFIEQKLDHFDKKNHKKWKMRYMANDEHYEPGGPVFINVGGDTEIKERDLERGHFYDIAKAEKAYMFRTEHRYYGESFPVEHLTLKGLIHLKVEQALGDLAHFVRHVKEKIMNNTVVKVIMKGVSYAGGIVVWFKHLYPDLVDGVWSSSARLISKLNLFEIGNFIHNTIKLAGGYDCYDAYKKAQKTIKNLIDDNDDSEVKRILNLCQSFSKFDPMDIFNIFNEITTNVAYLALEQNPANVRIARFCKMAKRVSSIAGGVVDFFQYIYKGVKSAFEPKRKCNDASYKSTIRKLENTSSSSKDSDERVALYQKCSQFGWFPTYELPDSDEKIVPLDYHIQKCKDAFAHNYTAQTVETEVDNSNGFFRKFLSQVEGIFMTQGEFDPWKLWGHLKNIAFALVPWSGEAMDTQSVSLKDVPLIVELKMKIKSIIGSWIRRIFD